MSNNNKLEFSRPTRAKSSSNHSLKRLAILGQDVKQKCRFSNTLEHHQLELTKGSIEVLQLNLGKLCNQTCEHCHVEAGPNRSETISEEVLEQVIEAARQLKPRTVDLTGGAPEMCPLFRKAVTAFRALELEVLVRSNLTILVEPGFEDMVTFLKEHRVRVVASLPCYTEENVDKQRGKGVFSASIEALKRLNKAGFGMPDSDLGLDLVYNPRGPALPGSQEELERDYKRTLGVKHGVTFDSLLCIANLPIGRFYSELIKRGQDKAYDELLLANFNPETVEHLMCRNTLNISWDGWVYDCDFNQMIELPARFQGRSLHISDIEELKALVDQKIEIGNHCYGCTAGTGSSCGGALVTG